MMRKYREVRPQYRLLEKGYQREMRTLFAVFFLKPLFINRKELIFDAFNRRDNKIALRCVPGSGLPLDVAAYGGDLSFCRNSLASKQGVAHLA